MKLERAVGIDLGTTNSAVAMMSPTGDEVILLADKFRRSTYPSIVGWEPDEGHFVSGWEAWNRRALLPPPVSSIKRKMGTRSEVTIGPHELAPEDVSAQILRGMLHDAAGFFQERLGLEIGVEGAVITVPAYFDAPQIEATRKAGELAGLRVVSLVQEPTAAAMYYAWKHGIGDGVFLVYDLGGGTFDVSVIRSLGGEYQVLGIDGDNFLGGDDFDRRLAEHFREHLVEQGYALDLNPAENADDAVRFLLLTRAAQEVKEALSSSGVHYVGRRDMFEDQNGDSVTLELEVSRDDFEGMIAGLVDQSIERCHAALAAATDVSGVTLSDVDHILLVGGSTRIPLVMRRVEEALCGDGSGASRPMQDEPDTCVALGAAVHAANLTGVRWTADERSMTVTTPLYTHTNELRILGRLEGPDELLAAAESAVLFNQAGDVVTIVRTEQREGHEFFEFDEVALPDAGRYEFRVEFCDSDGDPVAEFDIAAVRGASEEYRPTGGALSNPSVLAKDIYLEILRDSKAEREILLERGRSLPASGQFRFFTADKSGAVVLRLYQSRFPIRTIHLTVPDETPVGASVDLDIEVDESMAIVAQGEVAGQRFWAQIEAPPPREMRAWEDVEELLEQVDGVSRTLWGMEARFFRRHADPIVQGIRETARTDPDKLQALVARLEDLLEDYHNRDAELTPGWGRFEGVTDAIKRVVYRGDGSRQLGLSTEEWRSRLDELESAARTAYDNRDQGPWTAAFNQAQAIWESIAQDEYRFRHTNVEDQLKRLRVGLLGEIDDLRTALAAFNFSTNPETETLQRREVGRLEKELGGRVEKPLEKLDVERLSPAQAKTELDRLWEAAGAVRRGYEKLPTLGLVSR